MPSKTGYGNNGNGKKPNGKKPNGNGNGNKPKK